MPPIAAKLKGAQMGATPNSVIMPQGNAGASARKSKRVSRRGGRR